MACRNYITRFNTPIIRAYPKNKKHYVEEFESLKTYKTIKISELIPILMNKLGLNQYESLKLSRFLVEQSDEPSD